MKDRSHKNVHRLLRTRAGERGGEKYPNNITAAVIYEENLQFMPQKAIKSEVP